MKRMLFAACVLMVSATGQGKRSTFVIEIPIYIHGEFHADYIKVLGTSRLDAIANSGITVATETEWNDAARRTCGVNPKQPFCDPANIFDRTGK